MFAGPVMRRILIPSAVVVGAKEKTIQSDEEPLLCKPSQLPIYVPEPEKKEVTDDTPPSALEESIRSARQTIQKATGEIKAYERVGLDYFDQSKEKLDWLVTYLRKEDNSLPRAGAIAIGTVAGLILGLRGRFIKRTVYATTGGLGMAAVCYPQEAAEYSQVALVEVKKYLTIGYNFVMGVNKDDPPLELPSLPKIPTLSEAWDTVKSSATSLVSDDTSKAAATTTKDNKEPPAK